MSHPLERYVWELEKCAGCGACVSCCAKGALSFVEGHEHPVHRVIERKVGLSHRFLDPCERCDHLCEQVCPRFNQVARGEMSSVVSARSSLTATRSRFGDMLSDVLNQMLISALEADFIDGAIIHDVDRWPWETYSKVVTTPDEILGCAGHQLIWSPTLTSLNRAVHEKGLKRLAVVGSPCVMEAARLIQGSTSAGLRPYRESIRFLIGRFCEGVVNQRLVSQLMQEEMGLSPRSMARMDRSKEDRTLTVTKYDGNVKEISLANVQKFLRKGCARCTDYLAETSDLSIGYSGSREGYCTIITWTEAGDSLLQISEHTGHIEITKNVELEELRSARRSKLRRERSQELDELLLDMLESLTDGDRAREAVRRYRVMTEGGK